MARSRFAYAAGWDASPPFTNVETIVSRPPNVREATSLIPLVLGSVRSVSSSGQIRREGRTPIAWPWDSLLLAEFNALRVALFGNLTTPSVQLSILSLTDAGTWASVNVTAEHPFPGEHFNRVLYGVVNNVRVPLNIERTAGAFDYGHDIGHQV